MTTASERGWGWPGAPGSLAERAYRDHITTVHVAGIALVVRKEVAHLFEGFLAELVSTGYRLDVVADDWGFANRDIRGRPGVKSNHAWGLAADVNATTNPMTTDGRVHTDMPAGVSKMAARWGLRWGGDYTGARKDAMHFEFVGAPSDVRLYPFIPTTPQEAHMLVPGIVDTAIVPGANADDKGRYPFWAVQADGSVLAFNGAPFHGSCPGVGVKTSAVIAIHPTPAGYVLLSCDADDHAGASTYAFPVP